MPIIHQTGDKAGFRIDDKIVFDCQRFAVLDEAGDFDIEAPCQQEFRDIDAAEGFRQGFLS